MAEIRDAFQKAKEYPEPMNDFDDDVSRELGSVGLGDEVVVTTEGEEVVVVGHEEAATLGKVECAIAEHK